MELFRRRRPVCALRGRIRQDGPGAAKINYLEIKREESLTFTPMTSNLLSRDGGDMVKKDHLERNS